VDPFTESAVESCLKEPIGLNQFNRCMEKFTAYLISIGIVGFGIWIFADAKTVIWLGLVPVVVGLASLFGELQNDGAA
jgi:hypothetical protein